MYLVLKTQMRKALAESETIQPTDRTRPGIESPDPSNVRPRPCDEGQKLTGIANNRHLADGW